MQNSGIPVNDFALYCVPVGHVTFTAPILFLEYGKMSHAKKSLFGLNALRNGAALTKLSGGSKHCQGGH